MCKNSLPCGGKIILPPTACFEVIEHHVVAVYACDGDRKIVRAPGWQIFSGTALPRHRSLQASTTTNPILIVSAYDIARVLRNSSIMSGDIKDWLTTLDEMDQGGIKRLDSYRKSLLT